jgi:hypothetical protein
VRNTKHHTADLKEIQVSPDLKFASFDITDMYSNVPIQALINSIEQLCTQDNIDPEQKTEIITLSRLITTQNYFQFQNKTYIQKHGLAMRAPIYALFSEIHLQSTETTEILDILLTHYVVGYFRYVDDILISYNQKQTNIKDVLTQLNDSMPTMKFTMEEETDNTIHFLDIAITKTHDSLTFDIYRKPTTTDTIIPEHSCNPPEHKPAAIKFLTNRRDTYSLNDEK